MDRAKRAAGQIFSSYPDYGKAPKEYLASVIEYLAGMPDYVVDKLADRHLGIAAHCTYLPTIADLKAFSDKVMEDYAKKAAFERRKATRVAIPLGAYRGNREARFKPFPKLWAAFAEDPEALDRLNSGLTFNTLFDASKALATIGTAAARQIIMRPPGKKALDADTLTKIEVGTWSSADLKTPAKPASAELKAMMLGEDK